MPVPVVAPLLVIKPSEVQNTAPTFAKGLMPGKTGAISTRSVVQPCAFTLSESSLCAQKSTYCPSTATTGLNCRPAKPFQVAWLSPKLLLELLDSPNGWPSRRL